MQLFAELRRLEPGKGYQYKVAALNQVGKSEVSAPVVAMAGAGVPLPEEEGVLGPEGTVEGEVVRLDWSHPADAERAGVKVELR